jgi:phosphoglycolate phosphatase-like HAD superfamily hydrolase
MVVRPAYRASGAITGIIFDMDGTLTEPGAIDFSAMYRRCGISRIGGDIISQIEQVADPAERERMHRVIIEEEMKGCERMRLRPDLEAFLDALHRSRIRAALSTRNCFAAYERFLDVAAISDQRFSPALSRETLGGLNKPDPRVAAHVLTSWEASPETVWFVGDSEDDVACGKGAGCKTCLILTSYNRDVVKREGLVDLAVNSLSEFGQHIGLEL